MNLIDIFLTSLYLHFIKMKDKGRQVVPWFSTCVAVSFFAAITGGLAVKLILYNGRDTKNISEGPFIVVFLIVGLISFVSIKSYYFSGEKHIISSEVYLGKFSDRKKSAITMFSILFLLMLPFAFGFFVWLTSKPIQ
jgi:hypothetical protein